MTLLAIHLLSPSKNIFALRFRIGSRLEICPAGLFLLDKRALVSKNKFEFED